MLTKMKWRFIKASMFAFFTVMTLLMFGINAWNYSVTVQRLDGMLRQIATFSFLEPPKEKPKTPPMDFRNAPSQESPYMTRYFSILLDSRQNVILVNTDFISSISEEDAKNYGEAALEKKKEMGFLGEYRYLIGRAKNNGLQIIFLNAAKEQQFMKTLLFVSSFVGFISLGIVFLLVCLFSKRAARPYINNIKRQKQFITDASHELKTPLTSIAASADILTMEYENNEWVENIQKQTVKLSKLVKNLVMLSRLDEENPLPNKTNVLLSEVVWEMIEPFLAMAKAAHKTFVYHIEDGITTQGDQTLLCQIVSILLDNAMKYSDPNGCVRLDLYRKNRKILLKVSNTCSKKQEFDKDQLFERFYRPDKSRTSDTGGTGIGLSVAKAAVEAHKGNISVEWEDETTICFQVAL